MGKDSNISWVDHTFNPWHGCEKVSDGCKNCYAKTQADRFDKGLWGNWATASRKTFGNKYWSQPLKWNVQVERKTQTVFCGSMCDIFEETFDSNIYTERQKLFDLIRATPNLVWLLLTKRPENVRKIMPFSWEFSIYAPRNVWIGATIENEKSIQRFLYLENSIVFKKFISFEPLIGVLSYNEAVKLANMSDWGIIGGESGNSARRMSPASARTIISAYRDAGKKIFVKQVGNVLAKELGCSDKSGRIVSEWPEEFQIQEFPKW